MDDLRQEMNSRFNQYLRLLVRRRRIFYLTVGLPLIFSIVFVAVARPSYKAVGRILPTSDSANIGVMGFLSGLLGQQGMSSVDGVPSSFLYVDILNSRTVLGNVMSAEYTYNKRGKHVKADLYSIFKLPRTVESIEDFREKVSAKMNLENGMIKVTATAPKPELASQIVNVWLRELGNFNQNIRVTQAGENLKYIEERLERARAEHQVISDSLVEFLNANRGYPDAATPEVKAEVDRLESNVNIKDQVRILLSEQYEMARLTKQKTTPVVSILDTAIPPSEKDGPNRIPIFIISLAFCCVVMVISLTILEARSPTPVDMPVTWAEIRGALKKDWRLIVSVFRRRA